MDAYNEIQIEIQRLRDIRASIVIHTDRHRMLASNLDAMIETFSRSSNALNDIVSYRERKRQEYADGISYNEVKWLRITKEQIFSLFRDPRTGEIPDVRKAHISIEWCMYQPFIDNWMDRWYMVFDHSPHNNREMPLYFLRKMYAEFVLGKHVNYFDILEFHGVGLGIPQQHPNARHIDPNRPVAPPRRQLPRPDFPPRARLVPQAQESFLRLAQAVIRQSIYVQGTDQAGPSEPVAPSGIEVHLLVRQLHHLLVR